MKPITLVLLGLVGMAWPGVPDASAQEDGVTSSNPPSEALPRPDGMPDYLVRLTRSECLEILKFSGKADYVPAPDVTYRPGVDVRGNAVAPADLSGTTTLGDRLAEEITFELAINPLDYAGDPSLAERLSESRLSLSEVTVDRDTGEVRLDGDVLSRRPPKELIRACKGALGLTQ